MYYILEANDLKKVRHLKYDESNGWGLDFLKGHVVPPPQKKDSILISFECEKITLPDYFEADGVPIANQKFIQSLENSGTDNFQAIPVEIQFTDETISGYYLFNIIGRIECIDLNTTKYRNFGPSIIRMFNLKLNTDAINEANIFRAHKYQMVIFISKILKEMIEKYNLTGCAIREADGWNDSHRF